MLSLTYLVKNANKRNCYHIDNNQDMLFVPREL